MDELIARFNTAGVRYILIGGQAIRLKGMPRFSMDWDFYIPPRDEENFKKLNELLAEDLDLPLVALGPHGENFVQTYQTRFGILQFHLGGPGLPPFDDAERAAVLHDTESATPVKCLSGRHLLEAKRAANRPQDQVDIEFLVAREKAGNLI